jgi:hypothetical protein
MCPKPTATRKMARLYIDDCASQDKDARKTKTRATYAAVPSPTGVVSAAAHRHLDDPHPQFFMQAHCNVLPSAAGLDLGTHSDGAPLGAIPSGGAAHRGPPSWQTGLCHIKKAGACVARRVTHQVR